MNPLAWKREHQVALLCGVAVGAVVGATAGLLWSDGYSSFRWGALWCDRDGFSCVYLLKGYWLRIAGWTALGAAIAAALVYIRQLLRA